MFVAQWKKDYVEQTNVDPADKKNAYGETLREVIAGEVQSGFDTRDEMREVFDDIAADFDVSPDVVYEIYFAADY